MAAKLILHLLSWLNIMHRTISLNLCNVIQIIFNIFHSILSSFLAEHYAQNHISQPLYPL